VRNKQANTTKRVKQKHVKKKEKDGEKKEKSLVENKLHAFVVLFGKTISSCLFFQIVHLKLIKQICSFV